MAERPSLDTLRAAASKTEEVKALHQKLVDIAQRANIPNEKWDEVLPSSKNLGVPPVWLKFFLQPEFKAQFLENQPTKVVSFDCETSTDENGLPVFEIAATQDQNGVVLRWGKGQEKHLINYLTAQQIIITYNGLQFDFGVLDKASNGYRTQKLINAALDMALITNVILPMQKRNLSLWTVALNTILKYLPKLPWAGSKSSGAEHIPWVFANGNKEEIELIWEHCMDDVNAVMEIYAFYSPNPFVLTHYYYELIKLSVEKLRTLIDADLLYVDFKEGVIETLPEEMQQKIKKSQDAWQLLNELRDFFNDSTIEDITPRRYGDASEDTNSVGGSDRDLDWREILE